MHKPTNPDNDSGSDRSNEFGPPFTTMAEHPPGDGPYTVETEHRTTAALMQKAANAADYATNKAEEAASYAGRKADDAVNYVGQKTEDASAAAGGGLRSLGNSVRDSGPASGMAGDAAAAMADSLDRSGRYLQEESINDMTEDISNLIRRNPIPALLVGIAAGFLAGRAMSPRS